MGIKDIFNASKIKAENERLQLLLSPEMAEIDEQLKKIDELNNTIAKLEKQISDKQKGYGNLVSNIELKKKELVELDDKLIYQDFGLYTPKFVFASSDIYKEELMTIRQQQKDLIKRNIAVTGNMQWTVNGNQSKGRKMVQDMQKLLLRAFNAECDDAVEHVKCANYEQYLKKINKSYESISKLGSVMNIYITPAYYELKKDELALALDYQIKKNEEKEALKQARAEQREQARVQKEIEEQRKKIEKEQLHYKNAYNNLIRQLQSNPNDINLISRKNEIESKLNEIDSAIADLDYRIANHRAGYVYIISNIGAFGENIYKIGMTRRLEPQDRIDELGDASVPFNFDVHAMIFSDDAPALESALHRAFEDKKVNMVNHRREFFNVTLDEIKEVVYKNYDKTVEFVEIPDAEQYRQSIILKEQINN